MSGAALAVLVGALAALVLYARHPAVAALRRVDAQAVAQRALIEHLRDICDARARELTALERALRAERTERVGLQREFGTGTLLGALAEAHERGRRGRPLLRAAARPN